MNRRMFPIVACLLASSLLAGCAENKISIGGGDPKNELQQCLQFSAKGKHESAIQCFEMFKARYPQSVEGQEAELLIGDSYFARKEYLLAAESYGAFLRLYPQSPKADYAHYRIGVAYFKESPKAIDRDQAYLTDAIEHLRVVIRRYPNSEYRELAARTLFVALKRVARRHFYIGHFYYRTGEYIAAIPRFNEVAENFAESGLADKSLFLVVDANLKLKQFEAAREAFGALSAKFPQSPYTKKAQKKMLSAAKKRS